MLAVQEVKEVILPEPCTTEFEHHPHAFSVIALYNLGHSKTVVCQGYRVQKVTVTHG